MTRTSRAPAQIRYVDAVFCAASRVLSYVRRRTVAAHSFSTLHVRRGDLQYKQVKVDASVIAQSLADVWRDREPLYIATDEKNRSFFAPLAERRALIFLSDVIRDEPHALHGVPPNLFGMIEQVVAAHGRTFGGTFYSTFTGYITRLRGYYGFDESTSFYFAPPSAKRALHSHVWPHQPYYTREWPLAWRGLDLADDAPHDLNFTVEPEALARRQRQRAKARLCYSEMLLGFDTITAKCSATSRYFGINDELVLAPT